MPDGAGLPSMGIVLEDQSEYDAFVLCKRQYWFGERIRCKPDLADYTRVPPGLHLYMSDDQFRKVMDMINGKTMMGKVRQTAHRRRVALRVVLVLLIVAVGIFISPLLLMRTIIHKKTVKRIRLKIISFLDELRASRADSPFYNSGVHWAFARKNVVSSCQDEDAIYDLKYGTCRVLSNGIVAPRDAVVIFCAKKGGM